MPENPREASTWLAEELARQLTRVLESMTGEAPDVTYAPGEPSAAGIEAGPEQMLWWEQPFSLDPHALVWVGAAAPSWEEIGRRVLQSAGVEEQDQESIRGTYLEIVNQALSALASTVSNRVRKEVSCLEGRQAPPAPSADAATYSFEIHFGEPVFPVVVAFSAFLANPSATPPQTAQQVAAPAAAAALAEAQATNSIDLLLDVELPVSVSFGRAQLPLKDIIKLTTGSIVELNRALTEPVEVIVNNCVIARGEVVVVQGNYGIRIKQVISRRERLRTLY
jgi:flagellar motor switch protein FliN/FliY